MPRPPGRPPQTPLQPVDTRQQAVDAAVARVVENIAASLRAMIPEHAIRRLIELEVRAAVQALPPVMVERAAPPEPPSPPQPKTKLQPDPKPVLSPERLTYRVDEVAELVGVGDAAVWRWLRDGSLPSRKINRVRLIRRVDLEAFIDAMPASRGGPKDD